MNRWVGLGCAIVAGVGCGAKAVAPPSPIANTSPGPAPAAPAVKAFTTVPDFGCFARSADGDMIACVVGQRGFNIGPSHVELVFAGHPRRREPSAVVLVETEGESPGDDALAPAVREQVAISLDGMVALDREGPQVAATQADGRIATTPAIVVGGLTIEYAARTAAPTGQAPAFHTTLTVRRGQTPEVLDDGDKITPTVTARAFVLGDEVVIEQRHGIGDEGTFGEYGAVWRCDTEGCEPVGGG